MSTHTDTSRIIFRRGAKVVLRPLSVDDAPIVVSWMNDPHTTRYLNRKTPLTLEAERAWLEKVCANISHSATDVVVAIETHEGVHVGNTGLHNISWIHRVAETGTVIGRAEYRGKGYATDAKMFLLDVAFNTLGLHKVTSTVIAPNTASLRYAEKCGYTVEGVFKKHVYVQGQFLDEVHLAVFREDWEPLWEEYLSSVPQGALMR
jgi:RimJ/RimL family protein N-acetyltransferase